MGFARSVDHLDADELSIEDFVVPHPNSSVLYRVADDRMMPHAILRGDVAVVDRTERLNEGRIALVSVDGETRLVRVTRTDSGYTFTDRTPDGATVEFLGVASRIIRVLLP